MTIAPIFLRCVRCSQTFNYFHAKGHVCPEKENA